MAQIPDTYDMEIKRLASVYIPEIDWRLLKAQLWQESRFKADAVSPVGAKGIGQFMPETWDEVCNELNYPAGADPFNTSLNIRAAAFYMRKRIKGWSSPRPDADRISLALASYNAGFGNLLKAQKLAGGVNDYKSIIKQLPAVTGKHSAETIGYVTVIWKYYIELVTG